MHKLDYEHLKPKSPYFYLYLYSHTKDSFYKDCSLQVNSNRQPTIRSVIRRDVKSKE